MSETRKLRVFLCHASQDKPVVRELYQRLNAEGWIDTWFDEKKLLPGEDWRNLIEVAVEASDLVVICLSNNSVNKEGFIQKELRYAREIALEKPEDTIFLIPLRLEPCQVPRGLLFFQWVDVFGESKEKNYFSLLESLKVRYDQVLRREEEKAMYEKKESIASAEEKIKPLEISEDKNQNEDFHSELMISSILMVLTFFCCLIFGGTFPIILAIGASNSGGIFVGLIFSFIYLLFLVFIAFLLNFGSAIIFIIFGDEIIQWAFGLLLFLFQFINIPTDSIITNESTITAILKWFSIIALSVWNVILIFPFASIFIKAFMRRFLKR